MVVRRIFIDSKTNSIITNELLLTPEQWRRLNEKLAGLLFVLAYAIAKDQGEQDNAKPSMASKQPVIEINVPFGVFDNPPDR